MASFYQLPFDSNLMQRPPCISSITRFQQKHKANSFNTLGDIAEENIIENQSSNDDAPTCIECIKAVPVLLTSQLGPGDHIVFPRAKYDHHAIVADVTSTDGDTVVLEIIHASNTFSGAVTGSLSSFGKAVLCKEKLSFSIKKDSIMVVVYHMQHYLPTQIVKRAEAKFEEFIKNQAVEKTFVYNLFKNNCEHFATWCATGKKLSLQVRKVRMVFQMFWKSGFRGISDELQRNEKQYEYKMLCKTCFERNKTLLGVETKEVRKLDDVQVGDIIKFSYYFLWHLAVIIKITGYSTTELVCSIAHYNFGGFSANTICEEPKTIPFDGSVFVFDYSEYDVYSPQEVVERARKRLGEQRFSYFANDSSHFARWCKLKLYVGEK